MIFLFHGDCFRNSHLMSLKVTLPMMPMKSRTYNDAKGGENEKVCLDMNRDWSHLTVAMIVSYDKISCFYIDMGGSGRKRKDKPCNHTESVNFLRQDNPSYFSATYINANKSWPRSCFQCSIDFGSDYKVNNKHPVMVCEKSAKHDHVSYCWQNIQNSVY